MPATRTLPDCVQHELRNVIDEAHDDDPVVLWWDDGGYLEDLVRSASAELGYDFRAAERTPLELRSEAPRAGTVWYVPRARTDDFDWFRDVESTGGVVEGHIGKLAARCFEEDRLQAGSVRAAYEDTDGDERQKVAKTLYEELDGSGGLPSLRALQTKIVLNGHEDPVEFVIEHGAESLPEGDDLLKIRDLLVDEGVEAVEGATDGETIVERTRRWAVAEWLVHEGLDESLLPSEYRPDLGSGIGVSRPNLLSVLSKTDRSEDLARIYLDPEKEFWGSIVRDHGDPWELADCPVDAALEHELWEAWTEMYDNGEYEDCAARAEERHETLETKYDDVPWTRVWEQAVDVAELASQLETWEDRGDTDDIVDLYGDIDNGTWRIDDAVFSLIISGEPEGDLPDEHPASASLDGMRTSLVETRYLEYLTELGDLVVDQIDEGAPFVEENHAHRFFDEEKENLQSGQSVILFIIDALRFDLAHRLADSIRKELPNLEVDEETWVGTLPSDTEFGKAALTPGGKFSFGVELDDGELVPKRNGRKVTNYRREKLLKNDGWDYIMEESEEEDDRWGERVAYYWNDLDKAGEEEMAEFESLFEDRIEKISRIITEKLESGWERAYILSDHGFVSVPESPDLDDIYPPDDADHVTRRWVAGEDLPEDGDGVRVDEDTQLGYIGEGTEIRLLADPLQRFRNQGISDAKFYHGGVLPQEFVLNFVTITQE